MDDDDAFLYGDEAPTTQAPQQPAQKAADADYAAYDPLAEADEAGVAEGNAGQQQAAATQEDKQGQAAGEDGDGDEGEEEEDDEEEEDSDSVSTQIQWRRRHGCMRAHTGRTLTHVSPHTRGLAPTGS